jgi:hypothetical protein
VAVREEAITRFGVPGIFNIDQESRVTFVVFLAILGAGGTQIRMDNVDRAIGRISRMIS